MNLAVSSSEFTLIYLTPNKKGVEVEKKLSFKCANAIAFFDMLKVCLKVASKLDKPKEDKEDKKKTDDKHKKKVEEEPKPKKKVEEEPKPKPKKKVEEEPKESPKPKKKVEEEPKESPKPKKKVEEEPKESPKPKRKAVEEEAKESPKPKKKVEEEPKESPKPKKKAEEDIKEKTPLKKTGSTSSPLPPSLVSTPPSSGKVIAPPPASLLTKVDTADLRRIFDEYDEDGNGTIDSVELKSVLDSSLKGKIPASLFKKYQALMMEKYDKDKNGTIEFEEFIELYQDIVADPELPISLKPGNRKSAVVLETGEDAPKVKKNSLELTEKQKASAMAKFEEFDKDSSGTIDKEELAELLKDRMNKKMSPKLVQNFVDAQFEAYDKDGNGSIDVNEFLEMYAKLYLQQQQQAPPKDLPPPIA